MLSFFINMDDQPANDFKSSVISAKREEEID